MLIKVKITFWYHRHIKLYYLAVMENLQSYFLHFVKLEMQKTNKTQKDN